MDRRLILLKRWIEELRILKKFEEAEGALTENLGRTTSDKETAELEELLADVNEDWGRPEEMRWHLEAAVKASPGNADQRFRLAHSYGESGEALLAFYQYDLLSQGRRGTGDLNNLALLLEEFAMPITAVERFREAGKDNSLALGNLGRLFLAQGFVDEAKEVLERALNMPNVEEYVHSTSARVAGATDAERERLKRVRTAASAEHRLFLRKGEIVRSDAQPLDLGSLVGTWDTSIGPVTFTQDGSQFEATFKEGLWGWKLNGTVKGRIYSFTWVSDDVTQTNREGNGYFLFEAGGKLEGLLRDTPTKGEAKLVSATREEAQTPEAVPLRGSGASVIDQLRELAGGGGDHEERNE